jgi:phosphatidylserine/phosphatidylglycerophosphate/cardiolipin synthase-like enzyme
MDVGERKLIEAAVRFAAIAPADVVEQLAAGICGRLAVGAARGARDAAQAIGNPRHRALAGDFVEVWRAEAPGVTASVAAMALLSAAATEREHSRRQRIQLVWTGPSTTAIPARQTGEFLAGMIDTARRTLTLSSLGVFPVSRIGEGLRAAAGRGVVVRVILGDRPEDANWLDWRNQQAFGRRLPDNFALYHWRVENRLRDDAGNQGLMHAKCAIADRECLFLTSANLSGNAMAINMELGMCIHGGPLPEQVERHFDDLIARGDLQVFE